MFMLGLTLFFAFSLHARHILAEADGSISARYKVTDNVLELTVHKNHNNQTIPLRKRQFPSIGKSQDYISHVGDWYLVDVVVGHQPLSLAISTSSPVTWVASKYFHCINRRAKDVSQSKCNLGPLYNPDESITARGRFKKEETQRLSDNLWVRGKRTSEEVQIGTATGVRRPHYIFQYDILVAEEVQKEGSEKFSGILGLGFQRQHDEFPSIIEPMFFNTGHEMFSFALASRSRTRRGKSILAFGGIPDTPTDNRWDSTPIIDPSPGSSNGNMIHINGVVVIRPLERHYSRTKAGPFAKDQIPVEVNPSEFILLPPDIVEHIASSFSPRAQYVAGPASYVVRCDANAPSVGFTIGSTTYFVSDYDLIKDYPSQDHDYCLLMIKPSKSKYVLGSPWLKNVLAVFDHRAEVTNSKSPHGLMAFAGREGH